MPHTPDPTTATPAPVRPAAEPEPLAADPRRWFALALISVATLMIVLDSSIVTIALPHAQTDLHISPDNRQWVVTAYTLPFGGLLLIGGRIADFVGRKRVFLIGLLGFAGASALGAAAVDQAMLFSARALQGAFAAVLAPAALSLLAVTFTHAAERAKAFSVYGAVQGAGGALGLILGGILTEFASWRWTLFVNVPLAIAVAVLALNAVRESRAQGDRRYDVPGALLATGGLTALVYGFTQAASSGVGWLAPSTLTLLATALVLLAGFVAREARTSHPLLSLRMVLDRNRGGALLASLIIFAGMFGIFLFLTYFFQINLGYGPLTAALGFLPFSAGIIVTATLVSGLLDRLGPKPLLITGTAMGAAGLFMLSALHPGSTWLGGVLPAEIAMSIGLGMVFVPISTVALHGVAPHDAGVASAVLNATQQVGGALGTALLNTLYVAAFSSYLATHHPVTAAVQDGAYLHGYRIAFMAGGSLLTLALIILLALINAKRTNPQEAA
ncbi:MFS transporter [Streptomyces sp. GbtcB6]|uniref:MFS transporter n=1 Tax=Streptomyces sp. GbtcB6 TaxID=2824751 RepID=UPI001C2FB378|nr:MFS transporter [Streptomyces sp. GbtcB6]